jgi:hypothetical protein
MTDDELKYARQGRRNLVAQIESLEQRLARAERLFDAVLMDRLAALEENRRVVAELLERQANSLAKLEGKVNEE